MRLPYKGAGIALIYSDSKDDYILLGKRAGHPFHNRWSVPGGYFEKGNDTNIEDNATREFSEETGLIWTSIQSEYIAGWKLKLPFFYWETFIFTTNEFINEFKPDEFFELKWIKISEINSYKLRPFTKSEIKTFYKVLR